MDRIRIHDLLVRCILGINENERREKQDVVINLTLYTDLRKAGKSDRIEDTVDYRALKKRVFAMVEGSRYLLLEALAEAVAELCLDQHGVRLLPDGGLVNAEGVEIHEGVWVTISSRRDLDKGVVCSIAC